MLLMQAGDSLIDISGYYQQDCGCKMIRAAGCLIQLASNKTLITTDSSVRLQPG